MSTPKIDVMLNYVMLTKAKSPRALFVRATFTGRAAGNYG